MIQSLAEFAKSKPHIFCYGTGKMGKMLAMYCAAHKIEIHAFLVSDAQCPTRKFAGKPIRSIHEHLVGDDDGVLLATVLQNNITAMLALLDQCSSCKNVYIGKHYEDFCIHFQKLEERRRRRVSWLRKRGHLFNALEIGKPFQLMTVCKNPEEERIWVSNRVYGHDRMVKKFTGLGSYDTRKCTILHAAQFLPEFTKREMEPEDGNLFCMSSEPFRDFPMEKVSHVYEMGPYIHYVKPIISAQRIQRLKRRLGKLLLVAPSHVVYGEDGHSFSYAQFHHEIERIRQAHQFKTVIVCLGPGSFRPEYRTYRFYLKCGYKIVTAGDPMDLYFLARLKAFLMLADMVMGNDVTTLIGYSIALGKPFYFYEMDINETDARADSEDAGYDVVDINDWGRFKKKCASYFHDYSETITKEQLEFIASIWGKRPVHNRRNV